MAADYIKIDLYIKRQKEIFNAFLKSNGKKSAIMPYVEKYSQEDDKKYTLADILKYSKLYLNSSLITKEELKGYNNTKKVSNKVIFNRGKFLVQRLIESRGDIKEISKYAKIFAEIDDKPKAYPSTYLDTCRDYYLTHTKNTDKINNYNTIMNLSRRSNEYDVELINAILKFKEDDKAIEFIKEINISKSSIVELRQVYKLLYPANKKEISRLNRIIDEAFKMNKKVIKFVEQKNSYMTNDQKIKSIKRILEEFLITDTEDISELFAKYDFNEYKFNETLKDAKSSRDIILINLINNYYAKMSAIREMKRDIIDKIMNAVENGINYGNGYREFNIYDFYAIANCNSIDNLLKYAKEIYDSKKYNEIKIVFSKFKTKELNLSKKELIKEIKNEDIEISDEEISQIIDYIEYCNLPISKELILQAIERYTNNDISNVVNEIENRRIA